MKQGVFTQPGSFATDARSRAMHVRFAPKADKRRNGMSALCQSRPQQRSKIHRFIRSPRRRWRAPPGHLDAECARRFQVDHELEFGRSPHRQVGGLLALEDAAGIDANLTKRVCNVGSVAHQPAGCHKFTDRIRRRNPVARRQGGKLHAAGSEERVGSDEEGIGVLARKGGKSWATSPTSVNLMALPTRLIRT